MPTAISKPNGVRRLLGGGLLAVAAVLAISGIGASSAMALEEQCKGASIAGEGSSLQGKAQSIWTGSAGGKGFNGSVNANACSGTQGSGGKPTAAYTASGDLAGLEAWGLGSGELRNAADAYVATDLAPVNRVPSFSPEDRQIGEMKTGLGTKAASNIAVVPVTQTAIAVVVNLPASCTLTKITNANLEEIFRGTLKTWRLVTNASPTTVGGACDKPITRIVRFDGSGTTYQLKHYLSTISGATKCTTALGNRTWTQLQSYSKEGGVVPNQTWPDCAGTSPIAKSAENGGAALVKKVDSVDSSIGYAALPDAMNPANKPSGATTVLEVQDFEGEFGIEYAKPDAASNLANCSNVPYNLPRNEKGATVASWEAAGTTANLDWSQVYGSEKKVGGGKYSICTLTWILSASNSAGVFGESGATTARDYLKYLITPAGGQADISGNWYRTLPSTEASNVQLAAEKLVGLK